MKINKGYAKKNPGRFNLDKEEEETQKDLEAGKVDYLPVSATEKYAQWAAGQVKNKAISLRLPEADLNAIKAKAAKMGKKYQTYLGEIIHREAMKGLLVLVVALA